MELWQLDVVGGFLLADETSVKALTGIDDHSRYCVRARLMVGKRTQPVCDGLAAALRAHGVPERILTDNGNSSPAGSTIRRWRCCSTGSAEKTGWSIC